MADFPKLVHGVSMPEGRVYHMRMPQVAQYRFEWHENSKKVYFVRIGQTPEIAEIVVEPANTAHEAKTAVMLWCRGYLEAMQHMHLLPPGGFRPC
jgi:hypothetical protein